MKDEDIGYLTLLYRANDCIWDALKLTGKTSLDEEKKVDSIQLLSEAMSNITKVIGSSIPIMNNK